MAALKFRIDGLKELDRALAELPKATGKNVLKRVLSKGAQPIVTDAAAQAPVLSGLLKSRIGMGTRLSRRQARLHRKMFASDKASVEIFVGAGNVPEASLQEFGAYDDPPQPFMRPAWDRNKMGLLNGIKRDLWDEIRKAADRLARKAAKLAGL